MIDTVVPTRRSGLRLGAVWLAELVCPPPGLRYAPAPAGHPGLFFLTATLRGALSARTAGREAECGAGELYPHATSHPYDLRFGGDGPYHGLTVAVPEAMLPVRPYDLETLLGTPIPAREGMGSLLTSTLERLAAGAGSYRPADGPRLGSVLLDLVSAVVAHALDTEPCAAPGVPAQALTQRVHAFIQRNLADPRLTPESIASAHHISTRYLYRIFQAHDTTVARSIRRQRLERARRDLADPSLRSMAVHRIASRWGFGHAADFTRAFRTAYGLTPTDYRGSVLRV